MVAVHALDEIAAPRRVVQRIYSDHPDVRRLPAAVAKHFADRFLVPADPGALHQLPSLDASHPPESYSHGTLVRFRAMVQDTSLSNEIYLAKLSDDTCGGWGIEAPHLDHDVNALDPACLGTASVLWAVSVPAESPWCTAEQSRPAATSFPAHQPPQPHKFPIPGAPHVGVRVKIYDMAGAEELHSTDLVTFVGIYSSESLSTEDDSSPEIPVLHVLCCQVASETLVPTSSDPGVRSDLINWISNEALGGDSDAAEWLLLQLASKMCNHAFPLLPPSLDISRFPRPASPELVPTLSHILAELLPQYLLIPLSLDLLNNNSFLPESKEEDLHSGYLQLPLQTTILLTEGAVHEGQLLEKGIKNVRAVQNVMDSQKVEYIFPFSSKFAFDTDLSLIVVSEGRKSAFFQTSSNIPLRCSPTAPSLYRSKDQISLPSAEKLAAYRSYIAASKALSGKVQTSEETSKYIGDDFVRWRQEDKSVTQDKLIHLLRVARLLAASRLQDEVTIGVWEQAKELDGRREAR